MIVRTKEMYDALCVQVDSYGLPKTLAFIATKHVQQNLVMKQN